MSCYWKLLILFADRDHLEKVVHQDQVDLEESVVMEVLLASWDHQE